MPIRCIESLTAGLVHTTAKMLPFYLSLMGRFHDNIPDLVSLALGLFSVALCITEQIIMIDSYAD